MKDCIAHKEVYCYHLTEPVLDTYKTTVRNMVVLYI